MTQSGSHHEHRLAEGYAAQDFRASRARAFRRRDLGEVVAVCDDCGTEVDVPAPLHHRKCRVLVEASHAIATRQVEVSSPAGSRQRWDRAKMIAACDAFELEHGRWPRSGDHGKRGMPWFGTIRPEFGNMAGLVEATAQARIVDAGQDRREHVIDASGIGLTESGASDPVALPGDAADPGPVAVVEAGERDVSAPVRLRPCHQRPVTWYG